LETNTTIINNDPAGGDGNWQNSDFASSLLTYIDSKEYTLPTATTEVLGGIKIGEGLSIDSTGVISIDMNAMSIDTVDTLCSEVFGS